VRRADAIIVLERGRVVEVGRHDELINRPNGTYARLHQLQLLESKTDADDPAGSGSPRARPSGEAPKGEGRRLKAESR
jgi:subfamily B ATP-binding cassette protein HlyB/CyaB